MPSTEAVIFDLWGTLVPPFPREAHTDAIRACAATLGVDWIPLHQGWIDTFPRRLVGHYATVAANLSAILDDMGCRYERRQLAVAERLYTDWTKKHLQPYDGVLDVLARLKTAGMSVGLITNCAPDVPLALSESLLARHIDVAVCSCSEGVVKPSPEIYRRALERLGVEPAAALYIGDGSDNELTGAVAVGIPAMLAVVDLSATYDTVRDDVLRWRGRHLRGVARLFEEVPELAITASESRRPRLDA